MHHIAKIVKPMGDLRSGQQRALLQGFWSNALRYRLATQPRRQHVAPVFTNSGGGGEIRTHGQLALSPVFKTGALNRSATPPSHVILD